MKTSRPEGGAQELLTPELNFKYLVLKRWHDTWGKFIEMLIKRVYLWFQRALVDDIRPQAPKRPRY